MVENIGLIIVAAGRASRMGASVNKVLLKLGTHTILYKTIMCFVSILNISEIVIVIRPEDEAEVKEVIKSLNSAVPIVLTYGSDTRTKSVKCGLDALTSKISHVLVHDGARPFVPSNVIQKIVDDLSLYNGVIPVVPAIDTLKEVKDNIVHQTLDRSKVFGAQTPQGFKRECLIKMYDFALRSTLTFTDDASIAEAMQIDIHCVAGSRFNIKLTTPEDLVFGHAILDYLNRRKL